MKYDVFAPGTTNLIAQFEAPEGSPQDAINATIAEIQAEYAATRRPAGPSPAMQRLEREASARTEAVEPTTAKSALAADMRFAGGFEKGAGQMYGGALGFMPRLAGQTADLLGASPETVGKVERFVGRGGINPVTQGAAYLWEKATGAPVATADDISGYFGKRGGELIEAGRRIPTGALGGMVGDIAETAGTSAAPLLLTGGAGMPAIATASGLQQFQGTAEEAEQSYFAKAKARGMSDADARFEARQKAFAPALASGLVTGAATAVISPFGSKGVEGLLREPIKNLVVKGSLTQTGRNVIRELAKNFMSEATEEGVDAIGQAVIQRLFYRPELTLGTAMEEIAQQTAQGGMLGGVMSAGKVLPTTGYDYFKQDNRPASPVVPPQVEPDAPPLPTRLVPQPGEVEGMPPLPTGEATTEDEYFAMREGKAPPVEAAATPMLAPAPAPAPAPPAAEGEAPGYFQNPWTSVAVPGGPTVKPPTAWQLRQRILDKAQPSAQSDVTEITPPAETAPAPATAMQEKPVKQPGKRAAKAAAVVQPADKLETPAAAPTAWELRQNLLGKQGKVTPLGKGQKKKRKSVGRK